MWQKPVLSLLVGVTAVLLLLSPTRVGAQQVSGIAGAVRDTSGVPTAILKPRILQFSAQVNF